MKRRFREVERIERNSLQFSMFCVCAFRPKSPRAQKQQHEKTNSYFKKKKNISYRTHPLVFHICKLKYSIEQKGKIYFWILKIFSQKRQYQKQERILYHLVAVSYTDREQPLFTEKTNNRRERIPTKNRFSI